MSDFDGNDFFTDESIVGDPSPYLEREAMGAFTVGLTVLLDGIEAAMAGDQRR